jgi:hypothetical protein
MTNNQEEREEQSIPLAIDTRSPFREPRDRRTRRHRDAEAPNYLGGLEWHPAFKRYIEHVLPASVAAEREQAQREWRHWWTVPYVVARLRMHLETTPEDQGAVDAVIDLLSHPQMQPWQIARKHRKSVRWLIRQKCRAVRLVRQQYLPYSKSARLPVQESVPQGVTPTSLKLET